MVRVNIKKNDRYGRLRILEELQPYTSPSGRRERKFLCECDCGEQVEVMLCNLRRKNGKSLTRSCGCLGRENRRKSLLKHGMARTPTWVSWQSMTQRCQNKNSTSYPRYGSVGISVCERWSRFENFLEDMGERPEGKSLDRKDNTLGYSKDNCRWATKKEQSHNRRSVTWIASDGRNMTMSDWGYFIGGNKNTVSQRIRSGWSPEKAIFTKIR